MLARIFVAANVPVEETLPISITFVNPFLNESGINVSFESESTYPD